MLLDAYLSLEGPDVPGESKDAQFPDQIRILSAEIAAVSGEFGFDTKGSPTGPSAHRFEPVRVLKQLDKSTPLIFKGFSQSTAYQTATLSFCLPDPTPRSAKKIVYLEVVLEKVQIMRYSFVGNPATFRTRSGASPFTERDLLDIGPVDEFELSYRTIELTYKGADGKGNFSARHALQKGV
jgi:type VI secretion system Hcp family effector